MLKMLDIHKSFGGLQVIKGASVEIEEFQICGLIGPNGAGKSTFFNMISGILRPDSGQILFRGKDITKESSHNIANMGIGRTFQIVRPYKGLTVRENLLPALLYAGKMKGISNANKRADYILELVGLQDKSIALANDLTLSEKKSLEIAKALATQPNLLLLDEVFAGLSVSDIQQKIKMIKNISKELSLTVFIVEHVMKAVMEICDKVFVLASGEIISQGPPSKIVEDSKVIEVYLGKRREVNA